MLQNYLITALRNLTRHKLYSFINIAGLTVGLTCAIFIILFVRDQLSYDRWIPNSENLYRVEGILQLPGRQPTPSATMPFPLTQAMLEQIPEVKARTRLDRNLATVLVNDKQFAETVNSVDPNFFEVIRLPLVAGNPVSVLAEPDSVVLSQTVAKKYFGDSQAVGKTITISYLSCDQIGQNCNTQKDTLVVTGVLHDLPHNTQLAIDLVMSNLFKTDPTGPSVKKNWLTASTWGYVQLAPGADPRAVTAQIKTIIDHAVDLSVIVNIKVRSSELMAPQLTRFWDDHLSSDRYWPGAITPAGSWTTVYGFMTIGLLILLVACFNFTNLATARAMIRAREISLRKVVGATRRQLAIQFLGESALTAMIALALALALVEILLPSFDRLIATPIEFHYLADWPILASIIGIGIGVGLVSGVYPALVLSGTRSVSSLRSGASWQSGSGLLRSFLVVLQFSVSIGLGVTVLVIFAQISFARHVDLGFQKDGVVVIDTLSISPTTQQSFAKALRANPDIEDVAISDKDGIPFARGIELIPVEARGSASRQMFQVASVGPGYDQVYRVRLLNGRFLSQQHGGDTITDARGFGTSLPYNALINEAAARRLGYSVQDAIGKIITVQSAQATIVGVVADLKMEGANQQVPPTIYRYMPAVSQHISVRVRGERLSGTLSFIDRTWHSFVPSAVIARRFLNADFENQFLADEQQGVMFGIFVSIAIFIACLGLFGLAAFSTERRTKEIGIRKTLGARTKDIVLLLLWQFSVPVLVANLIAWPVAYYYLRQWLDGYAYRISLNPLYFIGAGAAALAIAWVTVIAHAAHVARANPIHALRHE